MEQQIKSKEDKKENKLWDLIKDLPIQIWALPKKKILEYFDLFAILDENKIVLKTKLKNNLGANLVVFLEESLKDFKRNIISIDVLQDGKIQISKNINE